MSGEIEELLATVDGGKGLLAEDNIPDENQSLTCFACGAKLKGLYCHECGNKNDNYRRSIISLIIELLGNITAVDSRMWRSLWSLLAKPGRMAREFADGARTRWTSPVRMYLATSLLLFGYIALSGTQLIAIGSLVSEEQPASIAVIGNETQSQRLLFFVKRSQIAELGSEQAQAEGEEFFRTFINDVNAAFDPDELRDAIDDINDQIEAAETELQRQPLITVRDRLEEQLEASLAAQANEDADEANSNSMSESPAATEQEPENDNNNEFNITGPDGETLSLDNDDLVAFYRRVIRNPEVINDSLNSNLKFAMFFMLPFAMLLGAIFIRGRDKAMLYDHLVHAAYVHAFSFILLFVFILLKQYTPIGGLLLIYTVILLIYLPISAKGMFGRGWFKSVLTAYGVGAVYTFNMMILSTVFVAGALSNVAKQIEQENAERARIEAIVTDALTEAPTDVPIETQSTPPSTPDPTD